MMVSSFVATDPQSHTGLTNTWLTPQYFFDELGEFDLDPCAAPSPRPFDTAKTMYELPTNGLEQDWLGRVWLNPPYGKEAKDWLEKLEAHGNGIALIFARTDTKWLQPVLERNGLFLLLGRVKFLKPDGSSDTNAGSPSILVPFGRKNIGAILSSNLPGIWKQ
jgi:hypothetical protein